MDQQTGALNIRLFSIRTLLALVAVAMTCAARIQSAGADEAKQPLRIACNLPLTGELATYGIAVKEGVLLALEESPDAAPLVDFAWQDNASLPVKAVTAARLQIVNKPHVYVSGVRPQTLAIAGDVSRHNIAHFAWIFDTSLQKVGKNMFRTYVSFKLEPALFVGYARQRAAKRVAILYVQLPHTEEEYRQYIPIGIKNSRPPPPREDGYIVTRKRDQTTNIVIEKISEGEAFSRNLPAAPINIDFPVFS